MVNCVGYYHHERLYDNYENFKNTSEIEQDHHEISPSTSPLTRNPTIPPKSGLRTPKVRATMGKTVQLIPHLVQCSAV